MKLNKKFNAVITSALMGLTLFTNSPMSASAAEITPAATSSTNILRSAYQIDLGNYETITVTVQGGIIVPSEANLTLLDTVTPISGGTPNNAVTILPTSCSPNVGAVTLTCLYVYNNFDAGTHDLLALYSGDPGVSGNDPSSGRQQFVVNPVTSQVSVSWDKSTDVWGYYETFTILVDLNPTGNGLADPSKLKTVITWPSGETETVSGSSLNCSDLNSTFLPATVETVTGTDLACTYSILIPKEKIGTVTVTTQYVDGVNITSSNTDSDSLTINMRPTTIELDLVDNTSIYGESRTPIADVYYVNSNSEHIAVDGWVDFYSTLVREENGDRALLGSCELSSGSCSITTRQYGKKPFSDVVDTITATYRGNTFYYGSSVDQAQIVELDTPVIGIYNTSETSQAFDSGETTFENHPDYGTYCVAPGSTDPDVFTAVNPVGCIPGAINTLYGDLRPLTITVENSYDSVFGVDNTASDSVWFQPEGSVTISYDLGVYTIVGPTAPTATPNVKYSCNLVASKDYSSCTVYVHPGLASGTHEMHVEYMPTYNQVGADSRTATYGVDSWSFYDSATATAYLDVFRAPSASSIEAVTPNSPSTYPDAVTVGVKVAGRELDSYNGAILWNFDYNQVNPTSLVTACSVTPSSCGDVLGWQEPAFVEAPYSVDGLNSPYLSGTSNTLSDLFYGCVLAVGVSHQATCNVEIPFNSLAPTDTNQYYSSSLGGNPYELVSNYIGNVNYLPSTSSAQNHEVLKALPTVSITTDADGAIYSDTITATVTVLGVAGGEAATSNGNTSVRITDISNHAYTPLSTMPCVVTDSEYSVGTQHGFQCEISTNRLHASTLLSGGERVLKAEYLGNEFYYAGETATVGVVIGQVTGVIQPADVNITFGSSPSIPFSFVTAEHGSERAFVLNEATNSALLWVSPTCVGIGYTSTSPANQAYTISCDPVNYPAGARVGSAWDYSFTYGTSTLTVDPVRTSDFIINANCPAIVCGTGNQTVDINYGQSVEFDNFYAFSIGNPGTAPKGTVYIYDNGTLLNTTNLTAPTLGSQPGAIAYCRIDKTSGFYSDQQSWLFNDCYTVAALSAGTHNVFAYFLSDNADYDSRWSRNRVTVNVAKVTPQVGINVTETVIYPGATFGISGTVVRPGDVTIPANPSNAANYDERTAPIGRIDFYVGKPAGNAPNTLIASCNLPTVSPTVVYGNVYGYQNGCSVTVDTLTSSTLSSSMTDYRFEARYVPGVDTNHLAATSTIDVLSIKVESVTALLTLNPSGTAHVGDVETVTVTVTGNSSFSLNGASVQLFATSAGSVAYNDLHLGTCTLSNFSAGVASCVVVSTLKETRAGIAIRALVSSIPTPYSTPVYSNFETLTVLAAYHTVTFDSNFATPSTVDQAGYTTTALRSNTFTRSGYTFAGWSRSRDGVVAFLNGVNYDFSADVTLYAVWTLNAVPQGPTVVTPVAPVIEWSNPASITTATPLSATQLNAVVTNPAGLAGTYVYSPALGSLLPAGTQTLSVTFVPTNSVSYTSVTKTVSIVVTGAPATVSVTGLNYVYNGTARTATVSTTPAGLATSVTYNGSSSAPVNAGTYAVVATVTASGYTGSATATLVISKADPVITWNTPSSVPAGSALTGTQLNASTNVPATCTYTPAIGSAVLAGANELSVTCAPTDSANYNSVSKTVEILGAINNLAITFKLGSSVIPASQLAKITEAAIVDGARITIVGYAQPSGNKKADLRLSLARANAAKAQILKLFPGAKVSIVAKGSTINPACSAALNKCVLVSVK